MKKIINYLPFFVLLFLPLLFYPVVDTSGWRSSSDVHALFEFTSSLLAITAGIMVLLHFFTTGRRFFLIISIGFILIGTEEFVHAIFSFNRIWPEIPSFFKLAISTTWLAGNFILTASFFIALLFGKKEIASVKRGLYAVVYNVVAFIIAVFFSLLIFSSPFLPHFVQLGSITKKLIELSLALLFFVAFLFYSNIYVKQQSRSPLLWSIIACIIFRVLAHIFVFDAQAFYDAHWDTAHLIVFLSYFFPIFGVWGETIKLHRSAQVQVIELAKEMTERKKAVNALQESEERLHFHTDNSPMAVVEWNTDFVVTRWTGAAEKMFGWSAEETIGKPIMELRMIYEEDIPIVQKTMERLSDGSSKHVVSTNRNYTKEGKVIICEWYNSVLLNPQGKMISVMSQVMDITERKHVEEALKESESKYRDLIDQAWDAIFVVDSTGKILLVNEQACRILGYTQEELLQLNVADTYLAKERAIATQRMATLQQGAYLRYERSMVRKDGTTFPIEVAIGMLSNGLIQGIVRDITERKRMEQELHVALEKYRVLFDAFPLGISITDTAGHIIETNRESERLLGISREEQTSRNYAGPEWQIICTDGTPMPVHEYASVRAMKGNCLVENVEMGIVKGDHEITWINVTAAPIPLENFGVAITYGDITERKHAEEVLRQSEERYHSLFENMLEGFAYCRMIFDQGKPQDFVYLAVNSAFESLTGLKNVVGRKITEVIPGIKEANPELLEIYGRVALTGKSERFEDYLEHLKAWLFISVYSPAKGYFVAVFDNITERKQAEEELRTSHLQLRALATRLQQIREEERLMIAREIHDEMGGGLTGLKMDLSWLLHKMGDADPGEERVALMDKIHTSNTLIDQMIHVLRRISTDLRPPVLDDLGLIAALEWQLSEFTSRTEISHEFATTFEHVNMERDMAVAVFRIFQEALTNVVRHSRATKVAVVLREGERSLFGDESLVLEIRDNGRGIIEEEILNPESLGLLGMKERVLAFGGELSIRGEPGGGTALVLQIPRKQGEAS